MPPAVRSDEAGPQRRESARLSAGRGLGEGQDQVFDDLVDRAGAAVPRLSFVRDLTRGIDPGRHPA